MVLFQFLRSKKGVQKINKKERIYFFTYTVYHIEIASYLGFFYQLDYLDLHNLHFLLICEYVHDRL